MRAVNLIPAEQRSAGVGAGRSEGAAYAVLALLAGVALLAFLYGRADHQIYARHAQAAALSAQAQRAQAQASQLAPFTSFVALREQRVAAVSTLVDSRFDWAHTFHEFGRVLPPGVSVSALSGVIGSASGSGASAGPATPSPSAAASAAPSSTAAGASPVTSATPPGSVPQFTISGCATSQPEVAQMLLRLRLIDGVSAVNLQSSAKSASTGAGSGAGSGGCPGGDPQFTAQVNFAPIPTPAVTHAAITSVKVPASTTSTGAPR
ncbi:MAG: hypothetical protein QOI03_1564 [Solirubrobacteraceae bacterium]|jgi:Tfp pilus assembly protein PilN|nr:hypothetical protein [Solirubrobacteraceae bacterium]